MRKTKNENEYNKATIAQNNIHLDGKEKTKTPVLKNLQMSITYPT